MLQQYQYHLCIAVLCKLIAAAADPNELAQHPLCLFSHMHCALCLRHRRLRCNISPRNETAIRGVLLQGPKSTQKLYRGGLNGCQKGRFTPGARRASAFVNESGFVQIPGPPIVK